MATTAVTSITAYTCFPETKGCSLEAIAEVFGDQVVFADATVSRIPVSDDREGFVEQHEGENKA